MVANHPTTLTERDAFGHWLSGLTDGEGCFFLSIDNRHEITSQFMIQLRSDDGTILESIRDYLGVGHLVNCKGQRSHCKGQRSHPQVKFYVRRVADLVAIIIPHFDRYPLRAKKRRDYLIWKQAVEFHYQVQCRSIIPLPGGKGGTYPRWTSRDVEQFVCYIDALRGQREFEASIVTPSSASRLKSSQQQLFE